MSTDIVPSVRLANDIAVQFVHRADPEAAASEIADHVRSFWESRMIDSLRHAAGDPSAGLHPLAERAALLLR